MSDEVIHTIPGGTVDGLLGLLNATLDWEQAMKKRINDGPPLDEVEQAAWNSHVAANRAVGTMWGTAIGVVLISPEAARVKRVREQG